MWDVILKTNVILIKLFLSLSLSEGDGQWPQCMTSIFMLATAETAMGSGF